jgi:hypothetical protein
MPKTTVDEQDTMPFSEHNIGASWQVCGVKAVAKAEAIQSTTNQNFGSGVLDPNCGHEGASLLFC